MDIVLLQVPAPDACCTPAKVVARVWQDDVLRAECFVGDATTVVAEDGVSSARLYGVQAEPTAWLPAVRLRPATLPAPDRCGGS